MEKKSTYPMEESLDLLKAFEKLDPQIVLSNPRATFNDPEISNILVEIANKLPKAPVGIQGYTVEGIKKMHDTALAVLSTSKSIANVRILTDRGNTVSA